MATITFDVYMPAGHTRALRSAFLQTARDLPGVADSRVSVNILPDPALPQEVVDQLAATYRPVGEDAGAVSYTHLTLPTNREV